MTDASPPAMAESDAPAEQPAENPADLLTAAMESPEVTDAELQAVDASLDAMMLEEGAATMQSGKPLLTIEEAKAKIKPEILEALSKKFKGSLTQTRHLDERDQIF